MSKFFTSSVDGTSSRFLGDVYIPVILHKVVKGLRWQLHRHKANVRERTSMIHIELITLVPH